MSKVQQASGTIPDFRSYQEEAEFWDTYSTEEFADEWEPVDLDLSEVRNRFIVEIDFEQATWQQLRDLARRRGVPLRDLARGWVLDGLASATTEADEVATGRAHPTE